MMLLTIFSVIGIETWSTAALFGYSLLAGLILALALSSQRWLLWYLFGGMAYWLAVEAIQSIVAGRPMLSELSEWHSYIIAMGISWLPLACWVLYRALRYEDVSQSVQQQRQLEAARYIEHTPVYDDDYQPRFH
ncbi:MULTISPECIES: AciT family ciprofloxacin tolerance protein [unclassified Psychrobacter]|uniref:AciT family ciprofloxacin tolerance protein n=1 Tax=unclassified Psychrobacter TaxID=196806 RepID=UPI001D17A260|nr:AciT family ciprofloxacin tolerance protein [Psychrobacter sp. P11F6]